MRLTVRDGLATVFVAAAAAVYLLWVTGAAMTGWSVRVAAAVVFGLGWAACVTDQKQMAVVYGAARGAGGRPRLTSCSYRASARWHWWPGSSPWWLAARRAMLVASMGGLWVIATARHTLTSGSGSPSRQPAKTV